MCRKNLNGEDTSQREYISRPPVPNPDGTTTEETAEEAPESASTPAATTAAEQTSEAASAAATDTTRNPEIYHDMDFD